MHGKPDSLDPGTPKDPTRHVPSVQVHTEHSSNGTLRQGERFQVFVVSPCQLAAHILCWLYVRGFAPLHVVSRKRAVLIEEDKERAYIPTYRFRDPMTVENGTCRLLPDRLMLRGTQVVVKRHKLPRYLTGT